MAALEPCYFQPNALQTPKDREVDKWLEKKNILLTWRRMQEVSCIFFSQNDVTSTRPSKFQNGGIQSFFKDALLQNSRYFRGWNFSEWKNVVIGGDKKVSFLEWPSPLNLSQIFGFCISVLFSHVLRASKPNKLVILAYQLSYMVWHKIFIVYSLDFVHYKITLCSKFQDCFKTT